MSGQHIIQQLLVKNNIILDKNDATMIEDNNPDKEYSCDKYTKSKGFTLLHKLVLIANKYQNFSDVVKEYIFNIKVIKLLLKNGADVNIQYNYGNTALSHCCVCRGIEIVNLLIQYKVNVNHQDNKGLTALMISSINSNKNDIEIAKLLLMSRVMNGANVNLQDKNGHTDIMKTMMSINKTCSLKMSQLLLMSCVEYDANPHDMQGISIFVDNIAKLNALS